MKVKNRKAVRRLSVKSFKAAGRRNITAAVAIAMTTVLFTALFTIMMSINTSYESYTFRQIGGYAHGTFKDVTSQQASMIERQLEGQSSRSAHHCRDHHGWRLCKNSC